jgi:hypothetical protein
MNLHDLGYTHLREINGQVCGLHKFAYTTGLMVDLHELGYELRYCFEKQEDAAAALAKWDGRGHPDGPWIKCKGRLNGVGVDLLNPALQIEEPALI